jgi:transposase-like protein
MEAWRRVELNYMRALRHPCLVSDLQTRDVCIRMDPHSQFCHNRRCRAYGLSGDGHLVIHSQKERRYRCKRCGRTFSESKGTALYRVHKPKWLVLAVVTLPSYGCPVQAIVAAFDLDERTVARWQKESGLQCRRVHEHLIEAGKVALLQVQADEIRVSRRSAGSTGWPPRWN